MRPIIQTSSLLICVLSCLFVSACSPKSGGPEQSATPTTVTSAADAASACALPSAMASSNEQTAWQLFVAANCPVNGQLTWTTWTEQTCFQKPASCASASLNANAASATPAPVRHFHGSELSIMRKRRAVSANALETTALPPCQAMTTATTPDLPPDMLPFVPKNLASAPTFCEEVFVDPAEASFVKAPSSGNSLITRAGQVAYSATASDAIAFPTPGVEVKADWLPSDALATPFTCANPPDGVYTETVDGKCYALVGIHVSSKLLPNWLWATFEPQNTTTNPNRCNPGLYSSCNDSWGSNPAASTGQSTAATPALEALMTQAGLPKALHNYRLVAAQSAYVDANNNPIQSGNSFVEFNAGVDVHQASCMTCHSYAMVTTKSIAENPNFGNFPGTPPIGTPGAAPPPPGGGKWLSQDFSWMLGIMPKGK